MSDTSVTPATQQQQRTTAKRTATQQQMQAALLSLLQEPLHSAWLLLDLADPASLERYVDAIKALTHQFGLVSSSQAAVYYQELRTAALGRSITVRPAPPADAAKVDSSIRWATRDLWTPQANPEATRVVTTGVAEKNVLDAGRQTIIQAVKSDRRATGWEREAEPGCCYFCAMLATRGPAYRSERSADFQAHDHCRCFAEPVFGAYQPSAQVQEWKSLYQSSTRRAHGMKNMQRAFREAYDSAYPAAQ